MVAVRPGRSFDPNPRACRRSSLHVVPASGGTVSRLRRTWLPVRARHGVVATIRSDPGFAEGAGR